jgi:AAA domain
VPKIDLGKGGKAPPSGPIKMLLCGDTGAGKTGALASLVAAGYNLHILDLDKGVDILHDYFTNPDSPYLKPNPPFWHGKPGTLDYVSLTEAMLVQQKNLVPRGDLWNRIIEQLSSWKDGESDLGHFSTWGPQDVLVIDGLSRLAASAFNFVLKINGRLTQQPQQSDYWNGQQMVLRFLGMLYADEVKCNIILICHIKYSENDDKLMQGFPQTIGKSIGKEIGQFFNHALQAKSDLRTGKRRILTDTKGLIDLKSASPLRVKPEYDLSTGLAEYFADVKGQKGDK